MFAKKLAVGLISLISLSATAQLSTDSISHQYVHTTLHYLADDKFKGRVNFSKEQLEITDFLAKEFESFGLQPIQGNTTFSWPFAVGNNNVAAKLIWNKNGIEGDAFKFFPAQLTNRHVSLDSCIILTAYPPFSPQLLLSNWRNNEPVVIQLILPDTVKAADVIANLKIPYGMPSADVLLVATNEKFSSGEILTDRKKTSSTLYNVIGMLPGKSKPNEVIVFSAHYDHISEDMYNNYGRVFNGANDNASGTTAVLALADYFSMRNDNERTILFCLFAGEELGLLGSRAFVSTIKPESIKAVINIEMIGMTNAVGKNAFMVTGPDRSTLFDILKKNVRGIDINVKPLRRDDRNLFERSDNYPFYLKNIPAHTIMCSDDNDNCYHQACDDADRIDTKNMTSIIRAIAKSAVTLINGNDTPVIK
jgi:hypothetical protein